MITTRSIFKKTKHDRKKQKKNEGRAQTVGEDQKMGAILGRKPITKRTIAWVMRMRTAASHARHSTSLPGF
jgi:hypothetical protein